MPGEHQKYRMTHNDPIPYKHLVALGFAAFAVQFLVSWFQPHPGYFWHTDSPAYWNNAASFLQDGTIVNTFFPMGASLLLAPLLAAGLEPFTVVLWVHPALSVFSVLMAFALVRPLEGPGAALAAGWCVALYPPLLNYSRQLLSEPWYVATLLAACAVLIQPGKGRAWWGGVLLGMTVLIRTPSLGVAVLVLGSLAFAKRPALEWLLCLAGTVLVLSGGTLLASRSDDRFVFLTTQGSMATSRRSVLGGEVSVPESEQKASYLAWLRKEPAAFLEQRLFSFVNMTSPWAFGETRSLATKLLIFLSDAPIILATLLAIRESLRTRWRPETWLLLCPALGLIGFHTLFVGQNRYRMPYMPFLICFSAVYLWPLLKTWLRGKDWLTGLGRY